VTILANGTSTIASNAITGSKVVDYSLGPADLNTGNYSINISGNAVTAGTAAYATTAGTATTASGLANGIYNYNAAPITVNANNSLLFGGQTSTYFLNTTGFDAGNLTSGTIPQARIPDQTNMHQHDASNLTNAGWLSYKVLINASNVTGDLSSWNNKIQLNAANITAGTFSSGLFTFPGGVNFTGDVNLATGGGNVGIGTMSPASKLEVNGNAQITSNGTVLNVTSGGDVVIMI